MRPSHFTPVYRSPFDLEGAGKHLSPPMAVIRDATMTTAEKRTLLASWASDERAVPDHPSLRRLDNGCLVEIDEVFTALKRLDQLKNCSDASYWSKRSSRLKKWRAFGLLGRRNRDDDDDDPPTPTPAVVRPRPPVLEGGVAMAF